MQACTASPRALPPSAPALSLANFHTHPFAARHSFGLSVEDGAWRFKPTSPPGGGCMSSHEALESALDLREFQRGFLDLMESRVPASRAEPLGPALHFSGGEPTTFGFGLRHQTKSTTALAPGWFRVPIEEAREVIESFGAILTAASPRTVRLLSCPGPWAAIISIRGEPRLRSPERNGTCVCKLGDFSARNVEEALTVATLFAAATAAIGMQTGSATWQVGMTRTWPDISSDPNLVAPTSGG